MNPNRNKLAHFRPGQMVEFLPYAPTDRADCIGYVEALDATAVRVRMQRSGKLERISPKDLKSLD